VISENQDTIAVLAFSPDSSRLLLFATPRDARESPIIALYPIENAAAPDVLHRGPAKSASFSPDGQLVIGVMENGTLRIWPLHGSGGVRTLSPPVGLHILDARFSADSSRVIGVDGRHVAVWDLHGGELVAQTFNITPQAPPAYGAPAAAPTLLVSVDGKRLLIGAGNALWVGDLRGQADNVIDTSLLPLQSIVISPEGKAFVSIDKSGQAWLWNTERQTEKLATALLRRLWTASRSCSEPPELLRRTAQRTLSWLHKDPRAACEKMQRCLHNKGSEDPFPTCYHDFQKTQRDSY
jgi:WD40 repeat protein